MFDTLFGLFNQGLQNSFNASQAQINREYQTSERLASQQFAEDWYNKYSSPSAMVQQYQEAGLNPALMYGNAGASVGDTQMSQPGAGSQAQSSPLAKLSAMLDEAQLKLMYEQTSYEALKAEGQRLSNEWYGRIQSNNMEYQDAMIDLFKSESKNNSAQFDVIVKNARMLDTQIENLSVDTANKLLTGENIKQQLQNLKQEWQSLSLHNQHEILLKSYGWFASDQKAQNIIDQAFNIARANNVEWDSALKQAQVASEWSDADIKEFESLCERRTGLKPGSTVMQVIANTFVTGMGLGRPQNTDESLYRDYQNRSENSYRKFGRGFQPGYFSNRYGSPRQYSFESLGLR